MQSEGLVSRAEILPLLGVVRQNNGWTMAHCPAHDDKKASLGLSQRGVLKCFTGCEFKDVLAALRARAGERPKGRSQARPDARAGEWVQTKVYEYRDPHTRELVAVKARYERPSVDGGKPEKRFAWRLPEGDYKSGIAPLTMADMPLWGGETVLASPDARVWVAEGEAATEAIRARNEIAVCGGWGAAQADFGEAFEVLRGRDVILWPDNDALGRTYMRNVRNALADIAASVVTVSAPVPQKGDAVEYFQQGGTVDALLANVLSKPTVDVVGLDHFVVRIPTESGIVAFEFDQMYRSRSALDCEVTVRHLHPGAEREPYSQRVNLLSQSARQALERALAGQFGKDMNWTTVVSVAYSRVQAAYFGQERAVHIAQLPDRQRVEFLIEPFLLREQPTVLFGDGGAGKTYLSYAMALSVVLGGSGVFGLRPAQSGAVCIVDYENPTGATLRMRFRRLIRGAGLDPLIMDELPIYYWAANGVPLNDHREALLRFIERHSVRLVIVDSAAPACGGKPEDAVVVTGYFNALNALGVTTLTIAHISKSDSEAATKYPFGSIFWSHLPRRTWFIKREQEEGSDVIDLGMFCRKGNDGGWPPARGFRLTFAADDGPVTLGPSDVRDVPSLERENSIGTRVYDYLLSNGQSTIATIAEELGAETSAVKSVLWRSRGTRFEVIGADGTAGGRGRQNTWGVLAG